MKILPENGQIQHEMHNFQQIMAGLRSNISQQAKAEHAVIVEVRKNSYQVYEQ